jgi:hypothetical protein
MNQTTRIGYLLTTTRLFIIDGVISLPVALAGFFVLPDVPEISRVWYLSEQVRGPPSEIFSLAEI